MNFVLKNKDIENINKKIVKLKKSIYAIDSYIMFMREINHEYNPRYLLSISYSYEKKLLILQNILNEKIK